MKQQPSVNVRLYGTEESPQVIRTFRAGALSVMFQYGSLRYVSLSGREAIRGISFVVRDEDWGTYLPRISSLNVTSADDSFCISYDAECGDTNQSLVYTASIEGSANGSLCFTVSGKAITPFLTNRTGFVVLHPVEGVAGAPVTVIHTDGSTEQSHFPVQIKPSQPFMDIRALRHQVAPGISVICILSGDTFEMEDQRNWTDASFKTYIRPFKRPHPFTLEPGEQFTQRVEVAVDGTAPTSQLRTANDPVTVVVGKDAIGIVPEFALAAHPDYANSTLKAADLIRRSRVGHLVCTFDASAGHDVSTMAQFKKIGEESGTRLVLEAVLPLRNSEGKFTNDPEVLDSDIAVVKRMADDAGVTFSMISTSPECYLKSYQPAGPWPSAPPLEQVYATARRAFPRAEIAAGMQSFFAEFNRHPPPVDAADLIIHSTSPNVHAEDDLSVMETLQTLPWVFASAHALGPGKPYWIGPTAIGMRFNPYGARTTPNPDNIRTVMATIDPRQRGLFNAAWTLGYIVRAAVGGVDGLCLSSAVGPFGLAWQKMDWSQPWFDELGVENAVFPVFHVIAGLAGRAGATVCAVECSNPAQLAALALDTKCGRELWLANLTSKPLNADVQGIELPVTVERLDSETFQACCLDPDALSLTANPVDSTRIELNAYAVLRIY